MTANEQIGMDAARVFQALAKGEVVEDMEHLLVAPKCLQSKVIEKIEEQIQKQKNGETAYIGLKMNSLTDKRIIDKLIDASKAGVKIDMIVRGICCLIPGVEGETENIHVISVVGRFLEHSRIYIFGNGEEAQYYIEMCIRDRVECGSFTKAAEQLSYSQSGISRMINDLEKEWKVVLLERSKSGVKLTSSGMKLLPYAERVCREYEKLQLEVDELQGLKSGLIRIGTFSSVATHWLPNIIKEFQKNYPNIDYEMLLGDYTDIEEWIMEGRIDCGFTRLPVRDEMDTIFLEQDRLLVVLPERHPLTELQKIPVSALCEEPFMLLEKGAKAEVSEIFERSNLKPKVHFTTWDDYAIMEMCIRDRRRKDRI